MVLLSSRLMGALQQERANIKRRMFNSSKTLRNFVHKIKTTKDDDADFPEKSQNLSPYLLCFGMHKELISFELTQKNIRVIIQEESFSIKEAHDIDIMLTLDLLCCFIMKVSA